MTDLREAIALTLCNFDSVRLDVPTMETINDFRFQVDRDVYLGMADAVLAILPDAESLAGALEPFAYAAFEADHYPDSEAFTIVLRPDDEDGLCDGTQEPESLITARQLRAARTALANYRKGTGREG